jgi:hypothetical protein
LLIVCFVILAGGCRVKIPVFLPARALTPGFLAHVRHARGNDNKNRTAAEAASLYCARLNELGTLAAAQDCRFGTSLRAMKQSIAPGGHYRGGGCHSSLSYSGTRFGLRVRWKQNDVRYGESVDRGSKTKNGGALSRRLGFHVLRAAAAAELAYVISGCILPDCAEDVDVVPASVSS